MNKYLVTKLELGLVDQFPLQRHPGTTCLKFDPDKPSRPLEYETEVIKGHLIWEKDEDGNIVKEMWGLTPEVAKTLKTFKAMVEEEVQHRFNDEIKRQRDYVTELQDKYDELKIDAVAEQEAKNHHKQMEINLTMELDRLCNSFWKRLKFLIKGKL